MCSPGAKATTNVSNCLCCAFFVSKHNVNLYRSDITFTESVYLMISKIELYMETNRCLICGFLVFWIQITIVPFACFNTQISVFDYMYFTVMFHNEAEDHYADRTYITKTCLYNFDPLQPHFYIVKLGFAGVHIIFLISAQKHRLWVLVRTASSRQF